jgi:hypothetical protein
LSKKDRARGGYLSRPISSFSFKIGWELLKYVENHRKIENMQDKIL